MSRFPTAIKLKGNTTQFIKPLYSSHLRAASEDIFKPGSCMLPKYL